MRVLSAEFLLSATGPSVGKGWPPEGPPEVAFAGRSNVGKSTLLQALTGKRGLVRISRTPGRTRLINFFRLLVGERAAPRELRFVDLPGFGYAKVAKSERQGWFEFVAGYLGGRAGLACVVLLVDARRAAGADPRTAGEPGGPLFDEAELHGWLKARGVVVLPVVTKADKLAKHERKPVAEVVSRVAGGPAVVVSGATGDGVPELWRALRGVLADRPQ